jgi:hypothetical protein
MAKRARMRVRNARAGKTHRLARILVTTAQAKQLGEDWSDFGCPFITAAGIAKAKAKAKGKKKAGRKK